MKYMIMTFGEAATWRRSRRTPITEMIDFMHGLN